MTETMNHCVVYIHGKGGSADEARHYAPLFPGDTVIGFDYQAQTPWEAKAEFPQFVDPLCGKYDAVRLIANSIGAYFALHALSDRPIEKAFLISPVVDMEQLIRNMMAGAGVSEEDLRRRGEIPTPFGETLSWAYLSYARSHPISWTIPTAILYGAADALTSYETISAFAGRIGAELTVMEAGEHWFHTEEQLRFLDAWIRERR